jgi:hypothetical protein
MARCKSGSESEAGPLALASGICQTPAPSPSRRGREEILHMEILSLSGLGLGVGAFEARPPLQVAVQMTRASRAAEFNGASCLTQH